MDRFAASALQVFRPVRAHLDWLMPVALLALCYVLFIHDLGGIGFLGPDEPRYAGVAREMYVSGDYITPRLGGETWFEKPILLYWLAAMAYSLLGVGETAARLPSALGATASVGLVYWCGRRLFSPKIGFSAALITATSVGFFSLARAASTDMLLTASLTAAMAFLLVGTTSEPPDRRRYFYAFYASLGLGVLAKGPVAVVLPGLTLVVFALLGAERDWKRWHPEGLALTAAVAGPWYTAAAWVNGREFLDEFVLNHNIQRFSSNLYGHTQPFYFYALVLPLLFFPWSFVLIPALFRRDGRSERLLLLWAAVPLVFFSLSTSKLPAYILPVIPPLALLSAREIVRTESTLGFRIGVGLQAALWAAIGTTLGFFPDVLNLDVQVGGLAAFVPALVVATALVGVAIWFPPPALGAFNVVSMTLLVLVITLAVFPRVQGIESMRPWSQELPRHVTDEQDVVLYKPDRWMEYGIQYYRSATPTVAVSEGELAALAAADGRILCIAKNDVLGELAASATLRIEVLAAVADQSAFWVWRP